MLKDKGWLWICEVRSRFAGQAAGAAGPQPTADGDAKTPASDWVMLSFTQCLQQLGFKLATKRVVNKMFVVLEARKQRAPTAAGDIAWPALKGCVYKKQ